MKNLPEEFSSKINDVGLPYQIGYCDGIMESYNALFNLREKYKSKCQPEKLFDLAIGALHSFAIERSLELNNIIENSKKEGETN